MGKLTDIGRPILAVPFTTRIALYTDTLSHTQWILPPLLIKI